MPVADKPQPSFYPTLCLSLTRPLHVRGCEGARVGVRTPVSLPLFSLSFWGSLPGRVAVWPSIRDSPPSPGAFVAPSGPAAAAAAAAASANNGLPAKTRMYTRGCAVPQ